MPFPLEDDQEWMEEGDEEALGAAPQVPPDMKLSVEVGLTQYNPNGLLGMIASAMVKDIGGADRWKARFRGLLVKEGQAKLRGLIDAEAALLFEGKREELRGLISQAFDDHFKEKVTEQGKPPDHYSADKAKPRMYWLVRELAKQAVEQAWKEIEAETKAQWTANIKAVVTELVTAKVERALPPPKTL